MDYKVIPIAQLEHASWDQVKDGDYVVPIGFPNQTSKESKYIDIWQLQDTINITQVIDQATERKSGLMSAEDKIKLNSLDLDQSINSNIINGFAEGSLRTINSTEENIDYLLGQNAFAEGKNTKAPGAASHAEGKGTIASGIASHAEGISSGSGTGQWDPIINTTASGIASHAEGLGTLASGVASHSEGENSVASGSSSHAQGGNITYGYAGESQKYSQASSTAAHAEGLGTLASGIASHSEGSCLRINETFVSSDLIQLQASGFASHAQGLGTKATAKASHAQNIGTIAASENQTAIGKYNIEDLESQYSLIVGNGQNHNDRSNAAALTWQGDLYLAGDIYTNNSVSESNKLVTSSQIVNKVNKTDIGFNTSGQTRNISNTSFLDLIYPVGSIYMSMNNTNPENLFGGVWQPLAQGKMLLGADGSNYITGHNSKGQGGNKDAIIPQHNHSITRDTNVSIDNNLITQPAFNSPNHTHSLSNYDNKRRAFVTCYGYGVTFGIGESLVDTGKKWSTVHIDANDNWFSVDSIGGGGGVPCGRVTSVNIPNNSITQPSFSCETTGTSITNANMPPYLVVNMWQRIS